MGRVYRARQHGLGRRVAVKLLRAGADAGPEEVERFRREAAAMARLSHPNIVAVYEVGDAADGPFFAMELAEGGSLAGRLGRKPRFDYRRAAADLETLARAVQYAHEQGVLHRDLKPGNVLLGADGALKITDFGLAKWLDQKGETRTGAVLGTPGYMAPEQAAGVTKKVGPEADVYALGAVLYEMLTGRPPFEAENPVDVVLQTLHAEPTPPTRLQPKAPRDLETICLKCLQKDRRRRYATAAALADDLHRFREGRPILARPVSWAGRALRWARRRPAAAALALVSAAAALALAVGGLWSNASLRQERDRADAARSRAEASRRTALKTADALVEELARGIKPIAGTRTKTVAHILDRARGVYEDLLREDPTPEVKAGQARMLNLFADLDLQMNDTAAALRDGQAAHDRFAELLADGDDPAWRTGLALSDETLGRTLAKRGDLAGALRASEESKGLRRRLLDERPDEPARLLGLAKSHALVFKVLDSQGRPAAAGEELMEATRLRNRAAELAPDDDDCRRAFGAGLENNGDALFSAADYAGARGNYEKAREVYRDLVAKDSDGAHADWREALVGVTLSVGQTYELECDYGQAIRTFDAAQAIAEDFARRDPDNVDWQRDVLRCRMHLAHVPVWKGIREGAPKPAAADPEDDLQHFEEEAGVFEQCERFARARVADDPGNAEWLYDAVNMRTQAGFIRLNLAKFGYHLADNLTKAGKALDPVEEEWLNLTRLDPTNAAWARGLQQAREYREKLREVKKAGN
jgi:tetratricopeptide (TPR) repeat protein